MRAAPSCTKMPIRFHAACPLPWPPARPCSRRCRSPSLRPLEQKGPERSPAPRPRKVSTMVTARTNTPARSNAQPSPDGGEDRDLDGVNRGDLTPRAVVTPDPSGCISPRSPSGPAAGSTPTTSPAPKRLVIDITAIGRGRFDASFGGSLIVAASKQPISEAARALHRIGFPDDAELVARHAGADHYAMRGLLGVWRQVRIREDRGVPRFVPWEPFPSRRVGPRKRQIAEGALRLPAIHSAHPARHPAQKQPTASAADSG